MEDNSDRGKGPVASCRFSRLKMLTGEVAMEKLKSANVAIFGIGGVGACAAEALARSGVGNLLLVDNDRVAITDFNRQIQADQRTIGRLKVDVMKERILYINPDAKVETHCVFYMPDKEDDLLKRDISYIVDAVDTVAAKIGLAMKAREYGIPIISCMGTGNRFDPTRLEITDISNTSGDPLARIMRKELKKRGIAPLKVLYSKELPVKPLSGYGAPEGSEEAPKENLKRNIPGSTAFVPPAAGLIIASEVVKDIISFRG